MPRCASVRECPQGFEYPTPYADHVGVRSDTAMKLVIAGSVIIGVVGSGCGDRSSARDTTKPGQVFSAPAFIREFEKQTGHKLFDLASPAIPGLPRVHRLDVINLHAPKDQSNRSEEELVRRFGHFSIFLYESARNAREALRGTAPDAQGIYWTHSVVERGPYAGESQWIAEKLYPENIIGSWGGSGKRLDDRWTRLDELLGKIAGAASP
jgi:hypothetical protein